MAPSTVVVIAIIAVVVIAALYSLSGSSGSASRHHSESLRTKTIVRGAGMHATTEFQPAYVEVEELTFDGTHVRRFTAKGTPNAVENAYVTYRTSPDRPGPAAVAGPGAGGRAAVAGRARGSASVGGGARPAAGVPSRASVARAAVRPVIDGDWK